MRVQVDVTCTEGTAEVHRSRDRSGMMLSPAIGTVRFTVMDAPKLPDNATPADIAKWAGENWSHAWNAAGVGQDGRNSGRVKMTPVNCPLVIREYKEVNHFLEPDAEDHHDHPVMVDQSLEVDTIGSNAVTLMAVRPL